MARGRDAAEKSLASHFRSEIFHADEAHAFLGHYGGVASPISGVSDHTYHHSWFDPFSVAAYYRS